MDDNGFSYDKLKQLVSPKKLKFGNDTKLRNLVFSEAEIRKSKLLSSLENKCQTVLKIYDPSEQIEITVSASKDERSREKEVLSCIINSQNHQQGYE